MKQTVGDYELLGELGSGGMGVVYRARHTQTRQEYALKLLRGADAEAAARFQREGEAWARVDEHPNVVRVRSLGRDGSTLFLVMDLALGGSLAQRVRDELPTPERAGAWIRALADALEHVHAQGVLHRDLKPENVLFHDDRPQLVDFGLARLADAASLTATGTVLGTPAYMAPEQVAGAPLDRRADVYGLGAVLYFTLTGAPPLDARGSTLQVMQRVLRDPVLPPSRRRPGLPAALDAVCLRALAKEPAERFARASELGAALAEALRAEPPGRRVHPLLLGALALTLTVAAGGGLALARLPAPAAPPPVTVAPEPSRSSTPESAAEHALRLARERRGRPCPGLHERTYSLARKLTDSGPPEEARLLLESVLTGAACRAQPKAHRELGLLLASPPYDEHARAEAHLVSAALAGDAKACWYLALLWLPEQLRPAAPLFVVPREPDEQAAAAALWLAARQAEEPAYEAHYRELRGLHYPRTEQEAWARLLEAHPPIDERTPAPAPARPAAVYRREPARTAQDRYDDYVALGGDVQRFPPERVEQGVAILHDVLMQPPSELHAQATHHLGILAHTRGDAPDAVELAFARAALLGSGRAAAVLGMEYYDRRLALTPQHLGREPNVDLALALFRLSCDFIPRHETNALIEREIRADGRALPGSAQAYARVWERYADAR